MKILITYIFFSFIVLLHADKLVKCDAVNTKYGTLTVAQHIDKQDEKIFQLQKELREKEKNLEVLRKSILDNNKNMHDNFSIVLKEIQYLGGFLILLAVIFGIWYNNRMQSAREMLDNFIKDGREHAFLTRQEGINTIKSMKDTQHEVLRNSNKLIEESQQQNHSQSEFLIDMQNSLNEEKTRMKDFVDKYAQMKDESKNELESMIDRHIRKYIDDNICERIKMCNKDSIDEW